MANRSSIIVTQKGGNVCSFITILLDHLTNLLRLRSYSYHCSGVTEQHLSSSLFVDVRERALGREAHLLRNKFKLVSAPSLVVVSLLLVFLSVSLHPPCGPSSS